MQGYMSRFSYNVTMKRGWLRYSKYLFQWKMVTDPMLFSERYGHTKYIKVGCVKLRFSKDK